MHIDYAYQTEIKRGIIENAMRRIGGFENFSISDMVAADKPYSYRNKMIFPIGKDRNGEIVCGFYAQRSHNIMPLDGCVAGGDFNGAVIRAVKEYMRENNVSPYDEKTHTGLVRRVFTRVSAKYGSVMVVISVNGDNLPNREKLIKKLRTVCPDIASVIVNINKKRTNLVLGDKNITVWGSDTIKDSLLGLDFEISPHSFFQINHDMTEKLYAKVLEFADLSGNENVMDIYCGIGTISLCAAKCAKSVIGVEIVEKAIEDARKNAESNGIENAEFYASSAEETVPKLIESGRRADVVILDPPRKGSEEKTLSAIVKAAPKRIVYVSCNPATLARDAKYLCENGYSITKSAGFDMFPNTMHVETVCQLVLRRSPVHINIDVDVEELVQDKRGQATYEQIKAYVLEHSGLKVSSLYIAQIKRKCGIIERENYNKPKSKDMKQLICPPEKEAAIMEALKHFHMV